MQALFKSPVVRSILAFIALIIVALAIWFIGPLLSFNELRPFATVAMRVSVIVLLLMLVVFWLLEWKLSVIGVTALCLLIWHATPLLAFSGLKPFEPVWVRALTIGIIVLLYVIWAMYTLWNLIRNDEAFAKKLFARDKNKPEALAREDIRVIGEKARTAIAQLKQMHMSIAGGTGSFIAGLRRLMEGKRYLYELPWYLIIGNAGAGKTSMLMNSGLKFPVGEQMGVASAHLSLAQDTGTQNCTWWFTNEAVLVDTAGRYTAPDVRQLSPEKNLPQPEHDDADGVKSASAVSTAEPGRQALNHAEWLGFLGVLRQVRTRAPLNGALLTVDVSELLCSDANQRIAQAAQFRQRLEELRQHLGIRFPVYVMLTKTDRLRGFVEYFSSLTSEARAQVWGFTLPWLTDSPTKAGLRKKQTAQQANSKVSAQTSTDDSYAAAAQADWPLKQQIAHELEALQRRISDGVATRLQEEFDEDRRQSLYLLSYELKAMAPALQQLLEAIFLDSRFDTTQTHHALRGVYFTSAMQHDKVTVVADQNAVIARLFASVHKLKDLLRGEPANNPGAPSSTRSYFLNDALTRVIFPESHLVKPNMRWEARFRLLRLLGHAAVLLIFFWLATGMLLSHKNNHAYLDEVAAKTKLLTTQVRQLYGNMNNSEITTVLGAAQALPMHTGLDLADPPTSYRFGLFSGTAIQQSSEAAYGQLQDRLVLPVIVERMEYVMREAVREHDTQKAAVTLRAYLLLHDLKKYSETPNAAQELQNWVMHDWQSTDKKNSDKRNGEKGSSDVKTNDKATRDNIDQGIDASREQVLGVVNAASAVPNLSVSFNNSAAMISYLNDMFSGRRVVQAATGVNQDVVHQVRNFLDSRSSSQRLYDGAKLAMKSSAPQDFTLVRALGPQAGTLFTRASGTSLEKGVPGMFTYDGYHEVFAKRLPELVRIAFQDDRWLMGENSGKQQEKKLAALDNEAEINAVAEDIRRQYLTEYTQHWNSFLEDIRVIQSNANGGTLSFELDVLRRLAAADSPLVRLARMAARETTLSRNLNVNANDANKSLLDKAADQLEKKIPQSILRPEQRLERELVDDRFAALREVVIGQSDTGLPGANAKPEIEVITGLLNEYYTVLVVADTALTANSLPPSGTDVANKIRIEAGKLPAPFQSILLGVGASGANKVEQGAASILRNQAQAQMDRLLGLMSLYVSEPCRRGIAGRYPFADSTQDASIEDFNAIFAAGSPADEFFKKSMAPLVDTSVRPWRYKSPDSANLMVNSDVLANGQAPAAAVTGPTLTGELLKLLSKSGPNPDIFDRMAQIRQVYFREPEAKRMALKLSASVQALDPSVTEVTMDFDGQVQRYAHGPVQPFTILWPGPRGGTLVDISVQPRIRPDTSMMSARGPWALLRLLDRGKITQSASAGRVDVEFEFDTRHMTLSLDTGGNNPLARNLLKGFSCPTS
jgi:type VI secretion system protein ImpL